MQKKCKLLVSDIDGTITDKHGNISSKDNEAIRKIYESGVKISLSTGRTAKGAIQIVQKLPGNGLHIFFDGALVSDSNLNQTIYARRIERQQLNQVVDLANLLGLTLELFSPSGYFVERESAIAGIHSDLMKLKWTVADFASLCQSEPIIMGCLVIPTADESKFKPILSKNEKESGIRFSWSSHAARPEIRMVNVVMKDVSKGIAMKALCDYLGIKLEEVIAIGDGMNDVSLLETAGMGIAMEGSPPELQAVADYITSDVDHSGFAEAMEKFLFKNEIV